ncbi:MAG: RnfABCDGE type electron transport complex subunit B [Ruminococcaceae bacterium]|nr:RnfABCDGE type electron transport complex subunit B [Oscillospiraceae bacterium]
MNGILIAIAIIGGIGLIGGILLAVISHFCNSGEENERLAEIRDALPGANCGACGYAGCDSYAEAVENGSAEPNLCAPGGKDTALKLSEILGVEIELTQKVARVNCNGCTENAQTKYNYTGMQSCKAAAALGGGMKSCDFACLGLGDCVNACEFGAISIKDGVAVVDEDICGGCGLCAKTCPKQVISVVTKKKSAVIPCNNKQKGGVARKNCKVACIGCSACVRACEFGAVTVENFLATIDADKCTACGKCVDACPQKIIVI